MVLGAALALAPTVLGSHPGASWGIPFAVLARASHGVRGARVVVALRVVVGCAWLGLMARVAAGELGAALSLGSDPSPRIALFVACALLAILPAVCGHAALRRVLTVLAWGLLALAAILIARHPNHLDLLASLRGGAELPDAAGVPGFLTSLGLTSAFWATRALGTTDLARRAASKRGEAIGLACGVLTGALCFGLAALAIDARAAFGADPPLGIAVRRAFLVLGALASATAAVGESIPLDLASLAPRVVRARLGAALCLVVSMGVLAWRPGDLIASDPPGAFLASWLLDVSILVGPVCGIILVDYFLIHRARLDIDDLYRRDGEYEFSGGWNIGAFIALLAGLGPVAPGLCASLGLIRADAVGALFSAMYAQGWLASFAVAGLVYYLLMKIRTALMSAARIAPT